MPKITFRGKEYTSLADMPAQVRHDYFKSRAGYDVPEEETKDRPGKMPSGLENMPEEVREIYQRVRGELDAKPLKTSPVDRLPTTEDLYRRSAPEGMQNQPSDESIYQPAPPVIEPPDPIIESDQAVRRLVLGLGVAILLLGIFLVLYFGG